MADASRRRRPARACGRRRGRRADHRPAGSAARTPPADRRRRRMRADRRPARCHGTEIALGKRFGVTAQLYALRRAGDQGIGDFSALAEAGEAAGGAGAAYLGVSPMHMLFPRDRERASPYYPSDRRFLDPILIDVFDAGLPRDASAEAALAALAPAAAKTAAARLVDYPEVWRIKHAALEALHGAFARLAAAQPGRPARRRLSRLRRAGRRSAEAIRRLPGDRRRRGGRELAPVAGGAAGRRSGRRRRCDRQGGEAFRLRALLSVGRRPATRPGGGARAQEWTDNRLLPRSRGRIRARRRRSLGAGEGADARRDCRAPPDPFSIQGQNWCLPAPNPLAGARQGWRNLSALYAANMRHAGMLRIDHAMGLQRLFLIPDGAKPSEGAYLSYPLDDLIGHIALESRRARCIVVGEDLGTVAEGFRERMTKAGVLGMRVLYFERNGAEFSPPARISDAVGGLRLDARPPDPRGLVAGNRYRGAAFARPPVARPGGRGDRGAAQGQANPRRRLAGRRPDRNGPGRGGPARRRDRGGGPRLRRRRRIDFSRAPSSTTSPAKRSRPTCPGPTASGRTGASGQRAMSRPFSRRVAPDPSCPPSRQDGGRPGLSAGGGTPPLLARTSSREITARSKSPRGRAGCRSPAC